MIVQQMNAHMRPRGLFPGWYTLSKENNPTKARARSLGLRILRRNYCDDTIKDNPVEAVIGTGPRFLATPAEEDSSFQGDEGDAQYYNEIFGVLKAREPQGNLLDAPKPGPVDGGSKTLSF